MFSKVITVAGFFALLACDNDPTKGKATATVAPAVSAPAPAAVAPTTVAAATSAAYVFSNNGSQVEFVGAKITGKHEGKFGAFRGTLKVNDNDATKGSVTAEIDVATLTADDPKLTGHLKSPDFFDVAKFPKATFTSTAIRAGGEKGSSHTVTGNLELHGVTKSISFPATIKLADDARDTVDVAAEFGINRKDFGIVYPGKPDDLIKDEVLLKLKLHATKG